ncbi:DUF2730 family protein [Thioclava sp.]|uniref:DUF2730 family protein n=1 Tax=Thioclava sp. TaxID=1933450 RepID=UPI003241F4CB
MNGEVFSFDATVSLSLIFAVASAFFSWWRTREAASAKVIKGVEDKVEDAKAKAIRLEMRMTEIERIVAGMPGSKELNGLTIALTEVRGELRTMSAIINGQEEIMKRIESSVSRHEDHLRTHG